MKKRILCMLLVFCMLLPMAACSGGTTPGGQGGGGGGGETDAVVWQDSIGDVVLDGEEVVVSVLDLYEYEMFGEEDSKDALDQMLYKRNSALQARFGVELVSAPTQSSGPYDQQSHFDEVQSAMLNGDADFDMVAMYAYQSGKLITSEYYLDWRKDIPYCRKRCSRR